MIYQGVHYGRRGGIGSDGDAMRADVVEGTGGDGADGDDDGSPGALDHGRER